MHLDRYLTRRKGGTIWQVRVPVPRALHARLGKREETKSLRTEDKTAATIRAAQIVGELHRKWALLCDPQPAPQVAPPNVEALEATAVKYAYDLLLADFDEKRGSLAAMTPSEFKQHRDEREHRLEQRRQQVATGNLAEMLGPARMIVRRERWALGETDPLFARFCELLAQANLAAFKAHGARLRGDINAESDDRIVRRVKDREAERAPDGESLSDLFEAYAQSQMRLGRKRADTVTQDRKLLKLFAGFVGERRRPASIGKKEAREFRDTLFALPTSMSIRKAYSGLTLREAAAKARRDGERTLDPRTVAKHISTVSPFFDWLVREGHADANPFDGLHPQPSRERSRRPSFTVPQVNELLSSPLFAGFAANGSEHVPGQVKTRDWRFWIPLLCLFTGARVGEVAQLHVGDVELRDGFWFIDLKEDLSTGQQTKSRKSRVVAVHPKLEAIGFIQHVQSAHTEGRQGALFPEVSKNARDHAGAQPSRFLRDYLRRIGLKGSRDGLGAHSFRHLMADQLRLAGYMDDELGPLVLGHGSSAPVTAGYGQVAQGTSQRLYSMIAAVEFKGVSFDHLLPAAEDA